ncbi:MAG: N-acylglucosamine [Bacteroidetes bacterium]|nr:MAG: N-acylglucosamine [Bacteroidota bacterium]
MDPNSKQLLHIYAELEAELHENILPFWMNRVSDPQTGGYHGKILSNGTVVSDAARGAVLNARILWTFSAAYNATGRDEYLKEAQKSCQYFVNHFLDRQNGGVFWSIDANGRVLNGRKQIYAQAFAIYALSEYYKASEDTEAIIYAIDLYNLIEKYAFDSLHNGYIEALSQEWRGLEDLRLSPKDANLPKSMNTHLHVLEAYTNLYGIWKDKELKAQLQNLVKIHHEKILNPRTGHFNLFFEMDWKPASEHYSYGHDIEGAWLIRRAASVIDNQMLLNASDLKALYMARVTLAEGVAADGSLLNEGLNGHVTDYDRHWWPQAEAIIGFIDAWEISREDSFLNAALKNWQFIKSHLRHPSGEWWWKVNDSYQPDLSQDLAGEWKCPYHNARLCIEILKRAPALVTKMPFQAANYKN